MGVTLLYWIYLLCTTLVIGSSFSKWFGYKNSNPFLIPFIGSFMIALLAGLWAIWGNLGVGFEIVLVVITVVLGISHSSELSTYFFSLKAKIIALPSFSKIVLTIIAVFALAQCASAPYIIDNESYYIQTIKWLDTYGYVPGLSNFHFFLGQNSGWHVLQSALNLNSLSSVLNDINGFYLLIGNAYALDKLNQYQTNKSSLFLTAGLLPIFNVFLFQFISSPSPDLPIYLITVILFTEFAMYFIADQKERAPILLLGFLVIFAVYIKVIAVFLLPLPLLLYLKDKGTFRNDILKIGIVGLLALVVFVVKNSIISGYPLYPLAYFKLDTDWAMPLELQQYLVDATKSYAFFITPEEYEQMNLIEKVTRWLALPKLHGIFNKSIVVLLLVFPFLFRQKIFRKPYLIIYLITVAQLLFLWLTSPQYRFFFGYFIILFCVLLAQVVKRVGYTKVILVLSTMLIAIPLFVPFSLKQVTDNSFKQELSTFSMSYLLKPHPQTKYPDATYKNLNFGNLNYNTPTNIDFFWATGDCELPCIQKQQLMDFKNYFEKAPQLRTQDLKDGFKSEYFPYE